MGFDNFWVNALWSLAPTVVIAVIFWVIMRSIVRADRTERHVYARIEAEERCKRGLDPKLPLL
jgi:flagellar biosynthesis/type III secretory pathway M-ring protein FliF/YscJ